MIIAQAVALYCALAPVPGCMQLVVPFQGAATEAACERAISIAQPSFLRDNPGYSRLENTPIECETIGGGGDGDA